ncbi:MAG: hypothetical protein R3C42_04665 [Parvularculaceae bacterium]
MKGLSSEVKSKLSQTRPATLGHGMGRIEGVTPAALAVLPLRHQEKSARRDDLWP